ncbi:hypothetical protein ABIE26_002697 [Pedobacter africanus]|uniref:Uncharacterized protein n=1 Tax=Pedobacter africanus TaxID=151894 RepID=A0ACC6KXR6_9SPHI|nr:hypothetical protein [Pedobacter africanus]MDR6783914.1 hypothetical protein [Pedobacter africanus]
MKKITNIFAKTLIIFSVVFVFSACKKDKADADNNAEKNSYTYQNGGNPVTVKLEKSDFEIDGKDITLRFLGITAPGVSRKIHVVLKYTGTPTQMPVGIFTKSSANIAFDGAVMYYGKGDLSYLVNGIDRKISIEKNGDNTYAINFEFTTGMGLVTGNYTGEVSKLN